ncbi:MAG: MFS transporter, partial [Pirellulaceae bacterium]
METLPLVETATTNSSVRFRLSVMMFLQYFIQGSYLPVASVYVQDALGFTEFQLGLFGSALAVGPLFAPFIIGQLVDRHWSTQRVLAISHLFGGVIMLLLYIETDVTTFVILGTLYSVLYIPTMMLTNSLAFHHLKNRNREFPRIRLFGTIGFVVPAWCVEYFWLRGLE